MTTTLISENTNSFDSIFEKKSTSEESSLLVLTKDSSFHEKILQKTLAFRISFLEKPKQKLFSFFKGFKFPFLSYSFLLIPLFLSIAGLHYFDNNALLFFSGVICFFSTVLSIGSLAEILNFKRQKNEFIAIINNISSIQHLLTIPKDIYSHLDNLFFSSLYFNDNKKFKNSMYEFHTLTHEELQTFLQSFSKEEISFINDFLVKRFENNTIQSLVIDDLINFLQEKLNINQKQQNHIVKLNNFKDFMSDYIPNEEETKTLKSLL